MIAFRSGQDALDPSTNYILEKAYDAPRVELLLSEHLDNAFESVEAAFKDDPIGLYLKAGKERTRFEQAIYKRIWKFRHDHDIKRKLAYTVNAGDAVIISTPPEGDVSKPSPIGRTIDVILSAIGNFFLWSNRHQEQVKRLIELQTKMTKLVDAELGDQTKSMYLIDLLATKPDLQGHGFGTTLLNAVLFSADLRGRSVYLTSSNTANVPFYKAFGFVTIGHFSLGEGNPKWDNPPVVVPLMVREVKGNV